MKLPWRLEHSDIMTPHPRRNRSCREKLQLFHKRKITAVSQEGNYSCFTKRERQLFQERERQLFQEREITAVSQEGNYSCFTRGKLQLFHKERKTAVPGERNHSCFIKTVSESLYSC